MPRINAAALALLGMLSLEGHGVALPIPEREEYHIDPNTLKYPEEYPRNPRTFQPKVEGTVVDVTENYDRRSRKMDGVHGRKAAKKWRKWFRS